MQPMFPDGVLKKPMLDRPAVASAATTPAPARAASKTTASLTAVILTMTPLLRHDGDRLDLDLDLGPVERSYLDNRVGRVGRRAEAPPLTHRPSVLRWPRASRCIARGGRPR